MNRRGFFGRLIAVPVGIVTGIRPAIAAGIEAHKQVKIEVNAALTGDHYRSAHRELMQAWEAYKNQAMEAAVKAVEKRK